MVLPARVALVTMPWARTDAPSIQCGILKSILTSAGHDVHVHYLNLALAHRIGSSRYDSIVEYGGSRNRLVGEWLWTKVTFGSKAVPPDEFFNDERIVGDLSKTETIDSISELQQVTLPAFIEDVLAERDWGSYDLVGFSSTFDQNVASLGLARWIKERHPQVLTVLGGANADGTMGAEYVRSMPWLDVAVRGEGERPILALAEAAASGGAITGIPGVWSRVDGEVVSGGEPSLAPSLDHLPPPDYDEYFDDLDRYGRVELLRGKRPQLLVESSRGCWWGAKHHCTFCGLNALGMDYRRKSVDRVMDEVEHLSSRYQTITFEAVDNIIDYGSMDDLCERLAASGFDYEFFYEVKANLTREQLTRLHSAGIRSIQPGIESLSTHVLGLMRKGSTQLINLRVLKWATYLRMRVGWSILVGFPGETSEDYAEQVALIPKVVHLRPPQGFGPLWMERFSPYFFEADHGFTNVQPRPGYEQAYPLDDIKIDEIAYFFDYDVAGVGSADDRSELGAAVQSWRDRWNGSTARPILNYFRGPGWIRVLDTRGGSTLRHNLEGDEARVLEALGDTFRSRSALQRALNDGQASMSEARMEQIVDELKGIDLVVDDGGHLFSLAMPVNHR